METRNEYFATIEIRVRNQVRKREIIPVRAGAQLCAIAKLINVIILGRQWIGAVGTQIQWISPRTEKEQQQNMRSFLT